MWKKCSHQEGQQRHKKKESKDFKDVFFCCGLETILIMGPALPGNHPTAKPDQAETQPVDITSLSPPASTPDGIDSPGETTEVKRIKFQKAKKVTDPNEKDHQCTESEGEAMGGSAMQACQTIQQVFS